MIGDLTAAQRSLASALKVAMGQDWPKPEPWIVEVAKLSPRTVIAELEYATDQQVFQISIMGQLYRCRLAVEALEDRLRPT